jgi:hypothetical protein
MKYFRKYPFLPFIIPSILGAVLYFTSGIPINTKTLIVFIWWCFLTIVGLLLPIPSLSANTTAEGIDRLTQTKSGRLFLRITYTMMVFLLLVMLLFIITSIKSSIG